MHTLGTLIEDGQYKQAIKEGNLSGLVGSFFQSAIGGNGNPLEKGVGGVHKGSYESMNRDAGALHLGVTPSRLSLTGRICLLRNRRIQLSVSAKRSCRHPIQAGRKSSTYPAHLCISLQKTFSDLLSLQNTLRRNGRLSKPSKQ